MNDIAQFMKSSDFEIELSQYIVREEVAHKGRVVGIVERGAGVHIVEDETEAHCLHSK